MHRLFVGLLLMLNGAPSHQSGRGLMHGYVAFEDISYNEVGEGKTHARVELRGSTRFDSGAVYTTTTNERGAYEFPSIGMGEYTLRITLAGHVPYTVELYIPSDFDCRLATMLKKEPAPRGESPSRH